MQKRNKMCPFCYLRKMFAGAPKVSERQFPPYENDVRKTPLMGWSSWNTFRNRISHELIVETAKAMKEKGLLDAGYGYVNLDDNWHSNLRDDNGEWQGDLVRFSKGIPALVKEVNDLGFKVGLYSSNGTLTCEDLPASLHREEADARTLAKWGVEYFKYDFCHNEKISSYAPLVYALEVAPLGGGESKEIQVSNALLKGLARRMKSKELPGGLYVSGLDSGSGRLIFDNVTVDKAGKYVLTVCIKKHGRYEKYLAVDVNGKPCGGIDFPPQKKYNVTARFQIVAELVAGRNTVELYNPVTDSPASAAIQYRKMAYALKKATKQVAEQTGQPEKPILFSICEWGFRKPWKWGYSAGNMWRTTPDIRPWWHWIKIIYERNVKLHGYASAGHFNDPDMLEVGNGKLTYEQNMSHFALWCMMSAPLVLGNDVRNISKPVLDIVTNKGLIAIDQDSLAKQAKRVRKGCVDVLAKPLADGSTAVCFFNKTGFSRRSSFNLAPLCRDDYVAMPELKGECEVLAGKAELKDGKLSATLAPDGVAVVRIR